MKDFTRRGLLAAGAAVATGILAGPAEAATGWISIEILRAGFIVGVSGGRGTLTFAGRRYPLTIGGVSAGATIGAASVQLVGTASRMRSARDIDGVYSAVGAGLSIVGGRSVAELSNARGVTLRLRGREVGFMFSIDLAGMSVSLA